MKGFMFFGHLSATSVQDAPSIFISNEIKEQMKKSSS
uniref:Uncharacterized protein n=1 Tax=Arundo donax TaxID=35708 RepID=A0A0A9E0P6_ARUDO